jgi:membrane protease YdiL (CAAX protease family)
MYKQKINRFGEVLLLIVPFFLNDIAYIYFQGTYNVFIVDYGIRVYIICAYGFLAGGFRPSAERLDREPGIAAVAVAIIAALMASFILRHFVEAPVNSMADWSRLFRYHRILDPILYWVDLSIGLFLVALSEELVFRKSVARWLAGLGATKLQIVLISAILFALAHWSLGLGSVFHVFLIGVVYMALFLELRRIWPLVIAHWIENFLVFGPL